MYRGRYTYIEPARLCAGGPAVLFRRYWGPLPMGSGVPSHYRLGTLEACIVYDKPFAEPALPFTFCPLTHAEYATI